MKSRIAAEKDTISQSSKDHLGPFICRHWSDAYTVIFNKTYDL